MDKERIAEMLKTIENLKTMFRAGVNRGKVVEIELYPKACADCIEAIEYLEASQARIARLEARVGELEAQAAAQAGGVVADDAGRFVVSHDGLLLVGSEKARAERHNVVGAYFDRLGNLQEIREGSLYDGHLQRLPTSRVLGEGEERIGVEELELLREIAGIARPRCRNMDTAALLKATRRLDALRAQATEGGA